MHVFFLRHKSYHSFCLMTLSVRNVLLNIIGEPYFYQNDKLYNNFFLQNSSIYSICAKEYPLKKPLTSKTCFLSQVVITQLSH